MMERDLEGWDEAAWERMRGAVDEVTDELAGPDAVRLGVLLSDAQATAGGRLLSVWPSELPNGRPDPAQLGCDTA